MPFKVMMRSISFSAAIAASAFCTGAVSAKIEQQRTLQVDELTVDGIIAAEDDLSTLASAFAAAGLVDVICPGCNYTLFAPTNTAFQEVEQDFLALLLTPEWIAHLTGLLSFHATESTTERVLSTDLRAGTVLSMLNGQNVTIAIDDDGVVVTNEFTEQAEVVQADIVAVNGVVHKVDTVMLPEFAVTDLIGLGNTVVGSGFTILFGLFDLLDIGGLLPATEVFTVLAPTDAAFLALGNDTLTSLQEVGNQALLTSILLNHVVEGVVPSSLVTDGLEAETLGQLSLTFSVDGEDITVNDASVVAVDVLANNGIVHAIDTVLMMPDAASTTEAPETPETTESPATADVPTEAPTLLTASPVPIASPEGNAATDSPAPSATTAVPTGIVFPIGTESPAEGETNTTTAPAPTGNSTVIDDIILEEDDLSTLAAAFNASGLVGVLCPDCNYTLFAPTNSAFSEIDQDFLTRLLTPPWVAHLTGLLSFHATQSTMERVLSIDLEDGAVITMLNGQNVTVAVVDEGLAVTSAFTEQSNVVQADIVADNGVLHKVDAVLIPEFVVTDLVGLGNSTGGSGFTILFGIFELLQIGGLIPATEFFTVFAPTDAAFLALGNDTLNSLLEEESRETLTSILLNHVVQGVVPSALVTDGLVADTVGELNLTFSVSPNGITVNNASVVVPDVLASNGIVHAIDAVLMMPTSTNTTESPVAPETTASPVAAPTATDPPNGDESPAPVAPQDETEAPVETPTTRSGGEAAFSFCSGLAGILMAVVISR